MIFFSSFRWIFGLPRATSWYGVALIKTSFRLETFRASNLLQTHPFVEGWKREREREGEKKDSQVDVYFLPRRRPPRRRRRGWSTILQFPAGNFLSTIFLYQALSDRQRGGGETFSSSWTFSTFKKSLPATAEGKKRCNYIIHRRIRILIRYKARLHARCGVSSRCQILLSAAHSALWTSLFRLDIVIQSVPVIAVQSFSMWKKYAENVK